MKEEKELYEFYIAGLQFHEAKNVLSKLNIGDELILTPEPENKYDHCAVKIEYLNPETAELTMLGYVPRKKDLSCIISGYLTIFPLRCVIIEINKDSKPWEQIKVKVEEI